MRLRPGFLSFALYLILSPATLSPPRAFAQSGKVVPAPTSKPTPTPETAAPNKGTGFGLTSIHRRLSLLFGRSDLLETSAADKIYTTTVKIPQRTT